MTTTRKIITGWVAYGIVAIFSSAWVWNHTPDSSWRLGEAYIAAVTWPIYWAYRVAVEITK